MANMTPEQRSADTAVIFLNILDDGPTLGYRVCGTLFPQNRIDDPDFGEYKIDEEEERVIKPFELRDRVPQDLRNAQQNESRKRRLKNLLIAKASKEGFRRVQVQDWTLGGKKPIISERVLARDQKREAK
jgi:hypothetical protein